jgi:hypothetical protein
METGLRVRVVAVQARKALPLLWVELHGERYCEPGSVGERYCEPGSVGERYCEPGSVGERYCEPGSVASALRVPPSAMQCPPP